MMEKVIEVSHLTKEYKNLKAIDDLSFNVYQGEILGLLGPNGCEKVQLLTLFYHYLNIKKDLLRFLVKR